MIHSEAQGILKEDLALMGVEYKPTTKDVMPSTSSKKQQSLNDSRVLSISGEKNSGRVRRCSDVTSSGTNANISVLSPPSMFRDQALNTHVTHNEILPTPHTPTSPSVTHRPPADAHLPPPEGYGGVGTSSRVVECQKNGRKRKTDNPTCTQRKSPRLMAEQRPGTHSATTGSNKKPKKRCTVASHSATPRSVRQADVSMCTPVRDETGTIITHGTTPELCSENICVAHVRSISPMADNLLIRSSNITTNPVAESQVLFSESMNEYDDSFLMNTQICELMERKSSILSKEEEKHTKNAEPVQIKGGYGCLVKSS